MISAIREVTSNTKKNNNCIENFKIRDIIIPIENVNESLVERQSHREFSKEIRRIDYLKLTDLCDYIQTFAKTLFAEVQESLSLYVIDNNSIIDNNLTDQPLIYIYKNSELLKQTTFIPVDRKSMYLQEEIHDASIILFFVWDINSLSKKYSLRYYREIMLISGFLGHQASLKATSEGFEGTLFSGISPAEYSVIFRKDLKEFLPVFAYAFQ